MTAPIVRVATEADQARVLAMAHAFLMATPYGPRVTNADEHLTRLIELALETGQIFLADIDGRTVGMLAALVYAHPIMGRPIATELVWWVDEGERRSGAGVALLDAAEAWARKNGAEAIECAEHGNPALERLYRRRGYVAREVIFEKDLRS
jgi:GNAT superfamily N-acetyltransferase